ncbi:hypothetical protein HJB80_02950 [Rhizobium lentis]|uniref:hypothetical protein n=1 Tax=Rhizobium lentis TaxID=1138194 RepID=UPI001C832EED|nr:hypothetical protein [Rhizobium lentis]MBX5131651.1 hypothetical protein [Rhizobium lentis]
MRNTIERHIIRYPNCRPSSIACKIKQDAMTEQLRREILDEQLRRTPRPWWQRLLKALRGGETHV